MITVVGEALVDLIEEAPGHPVAYPGGSPANVAVALARLGQPVNLVTQVGDDEYGNLLLAHLRHNGVRLSPASLTNCPSTSTARTALAPDGQASYIFDIAWRRFGAGGPRAGEREPGTEPEAPVACLHTGSIAALLPPGADDVLAMVRAARDNSMISFDPNCRPSLLGDATSARQRTAQIVANSDIIKASLDDIAWMYPDSPYQKVAHEWLDLGARLVVVTRGGDGVWACSRNHEVAIAARTVKVVDTVGAGDSLTAGLLTALDDADLLGASRRPQLDSIDEATLVRVLTFASRVAAITCSRRGADPPSAAELTSEV